jgi:hypothetical protein
VAGHYLDVRLIAVVFAVACSSATTPAPTNVGSPPPGDPDQVVVQLAYRGTFFIGPPFAHLPAFTLMGDGTLIGNDEGTLYTTKLPAPEVRRIVDHVIELGFDKLESHEEHCQKIGGDRMICTSDGTYTILRVTSPATGKLREIVSYEGFSNAPEVLKQIVAYLEHHSHPHAGGYRPTTAIVHVQPNHGPVVEPCPAIDKALLHVVPDQTVWGIRLAGAELDAYLKLYRASHGKRFVCAEGAMYELTLVPGVPGSTHLDEEMEIYDRFEKRDKE